MAALRKTSNLMTIGGVMAAFGTMLTGLPLVVLQAYAQVVKDGVPHWFSVLILPMMLIGFVLAGVGSAILGVAGRGQDDVPTQPQVIAATAEAKAEQKVEAAKVDPAKGGQ